MKRLIAHVSMLILLIGIGLSTSAQEHNHQVLSAYLLLKDALVNSDANTTADQAIVLNKAIKEFDIRSLSEVKKSTTIVLKPKLEADAQKISIEKDITKQRAIFERLSQNIIALAKMTKLADHSIYVQYCPMNKAYWLSTEKAIKNPYYGKQMLTCGSIKETI